MLLELAARSLWGTLAAAKASEKLVWRLYPGVEILATFCEVISSRRSVDESIVCPMSAICPIRSMLNPKTKITSPNYDSILPGLTIDVLSSLKLSI